MAEAFPTTGSASVDVDATASAVFAYLTDLDTLPGLSPENQRCEFLDGASELAVGARFRGFNEAGGYEWHADCAVTVLDADEHFEYVVPPDFEHATTWSYRIEATGPTTCTVTESFDAPLLALPDIYPGKIEGRCENLQRACETTMANLQAAFRS